MKLLRVALLLLPSLLRGQNPVITASGSSFSYTVGTSVFCAARYLKPQVQLYCFHTITTTWDTLYFNSIFLVSAPPYNMDLPAYSQDVAKFQFTKDETTGALSWQVLTSAGTVLQQGTFQ